MVEIFLPPPKGKTLNPIWYELYEHDFIYRIIDKNSKYFKSSSEFRAVGPFHRFDHHIEKSKSRGVMYCSRNIDCCIFECFFTSGIIKLKEIFFLEILLNKKIKLLDLRCQFDLNNISGAIYCGAPPSITSHPDRFITQKWAQYFYENFDDMDGIIWNSANCGMDAIVLNERAKKKIHIQKETEFLKRDLLMKIFSFIERYSYHSFNISSDEIRYIGRFSQMRTR